ncbi:MAG: hypothetical protein AAGC92_08230 [Pseudomonadota bacterium]
MDTLPQIALRHHRGAWLADNATALGRQALGGFPRIPVMRDFGDDSWHWSDRAEFAVSAEARGAAARSRSWWMRPEHKEWRALLLSGAPVWVREGGRETPSSLGVFEIEDVILDESEFSFRIARKLAEAAA